MPATMEKKAVEKKAVEKKAVRLNVGLSEKNYQELNALAGDLDMNMSEYVRNAIRVYTYLQRQKIEGKQIYAGRNGHAEQEIVLP